MESNKSRTAFVLFATAVVCFGFGAATRGGGAGTSRGSVVSVIAIENIPPYVNRWCLARDAASVASADAAIVAFGEGRSRHLYAYPQTRSSGLAAQDTVLSEIDTCSIKKIAAKRTADASVDERGRP